MFSNSVGDARTRVAGGLAKEHSKGWEQTLAMRIMLQRLLDTANKLPLLPTQISGKLENGDCDILCDGAQLKDLFPLLTEPPVTDGAEKSNKKRKIKLEDGNDFERKRSSPHQSDTYLTDAAAKDLAEGLNSLSEAAKLLKSSLSSMNDALKMQVHASETKDRERILENNASLESSVEREEVNESSRVWKELIAAQQCMEPRWETVLTRWHARMNFGSELAKSKMKVFNVNIWQQVEDELEDKARSWERSRMPVTESSRIDRSLPFLPRPHTSSAAGAAKHSIKNSRSRSCSNISRIDGATEVSTDSEQDSEAECKEGESPAGSRQGGRQGSEGAGLGTHMGMDLEVYDDRTFYSVLLKSFISGSAAQRGGGEGGALSMRAADLAALRKYKKKKLDVDRRASKGRKVRYVVHQKLQHFMFPTPYAALHHLAGTTSTGYSGSISAGMSMGVESSSSSTGGGREAGFAGAGMDTEKLFQSLFQ